MTKADERRLSKIEGALTPKQAFLLWLEEAREHGSFATHVLSMRGQPIEQHPYQRLPRQVEQAVRERYKGAGAPEVNHSVHPTRGLQQAQAERQIEAEVIRAVRETAFFYELHVALTGRLAMEWRAMAFQLLLAIRMNHDLMLDKEPKQEEIDKTRQWIVNAAGDLRMWQTVARQLADRFVDGRSLLFPEQEGHLAESIETAEWLVAHFEDHMSWLAFLRDDAGKARKGKKQSLTPVPAAELDLTPIDVDELNTAVEREAAQTAEQIVYMAKAEAAMFVHQSDLAVELLDRVWVGANDS